MKNIVLGFMAFAATTIFANASATAAPLPTGLQTFAFAGLCSDCTGTGVAELTLQNYTVGSQIDANNFVSFHYDGTDLLPAFTINSGDLSFVNGAMSGPFPSTEDFAVGSNSKVFYSSNGGFWCVGGSCLADYGFSHSWTQASVVASVPESATWGMLVIGVGAMGYAMRRKQKVRVSYAA